MTKLTLLLASVAMMFGQAATVNVGGKSVTVNILPRSTVTFALASGTADANGNITLNLSLTTTRQPSAAVQFDMTFVQADIKSLSAALGPAAVSANKQIQCNVLSVTAQRCLIFGQNLATIGNGVTAVVSVNVNRATTVSVANVVASTILGNGLNTAITAGGGLITMPAGVASVTCITPAWDIGLPANTWNLEPQEQLSCTATLATAAPAGGLVVIATSSVPGITISPVTFAAGATTAIFTLTGQ